MFWIGCQVHIALRPVAPGMIHHIVEALVENQQPVEYGQVLFKVDPLG